jgi:uncharacterized protein (TIGR03435 family)
MYRATCQGGPGTRFKDFFYCTDATTGIMAMAAFDLKPYQLSGIKLDDAARFEVRATIPAGTTHDQVLTMFQNLLKERFHFAWHFEKREMPVFELTKIGDGPRLRPWSDEPEAAEDSGAAAAKTASGRPPLKRGGVGMGNSLTGNGVHYFEGNGVPLSELINDVISFRLKRKVIDRTGLTGDFKISLYYKDEADVDPAALSRNEIKSPPGYDPDPPDLTGALKEQLGLKLASRKDFVDVLIIDRFDKVPTPN